MVGRPPTPLSTCPFCGYCLDGLPSRHPCPECGRPFDRETQVFGGLSRRGGSRTLSRGLRGFLVYKLSIVLALVIGIGLWERGARFLTFPGPGTPILIVAVIIAGILVAIIGARSHCVVVVATDRVEILRRGKETVRIPMSEIVTATHQHLRKRIVIQTKSDEHRVTVWELSPFDLSVADACARAVRDRVAERSFSEGGGGQTTTPTTSAD